MHAILLDERKLGVCVVLQGRGDPAKPAQPETGRGAPPHPTHALALPCAAHLICSNPWCLQDGLPGLRPAGELFRISRGSQRAIGSLMVVTPMGAQRHYTMSYRCGWRSVMGRLTSSCCARWRGGVRFDQAPCKPACEGVAKVVVHMRWLQMALDRQARESAREDRGCALNAQIICGICSCMRVHLRCGRSEFYTRLRTDASFAGWFKPLYEDMLAVVASGQRWVLGAEDDAWHWGSGLSKRYVGQGGQDEGCIAAAVTRQRGPFQTKSDRYEMSKPAHALCAQVGRAARVPRHPLEPPAASAAAGHRRH